MRPAGDHVPDRTVRQGKLPGKLPKRTALCPSFADSLCILIRQTAPAIFLVRHKPEICEAVILPVAVDVIHIRIKIRRNSTAENPDCTVQ